MSALCDSKGSMASSHIDDDEPATKYYFMCRKFSKPAGCSASETAIFVFHLRWKSLPSVEAGRCKN